MCIGFILSQLLALHTMHVESLWIVSTLLGGVYGALFNVMPMLVLEWFGIGMSCLSQFADGISGRPPSGRLNSVLDGMRRSKGENIS